VKRLSGRYRSRGGAFRDIKTVRVRRPRVGRAGDLKIAGVSEKRRARARLPAMAVDANRVKTAALLFERRRRALKQWAANPNANEVIRNIYGPSAAGRGAHDVYICDINNMHYSSNEIEMHRVACMVVEKNEKKNFKKTARSRLEMFSSMTAVNSLKSCLLVHS